LGRGWLALALPLPFKPYLPIPMILESRPISLGFGYERRAWPRAVHHVARLGRREARLIVEDGESVGVLAVVAFLVAGLL
jgi:hypothetical protein